MPLWGAVLLAAVPTAIGTVVDILIWTQPDILFKACFFVGCVLAVLLVKRRSVFGPMVQPPLVLTIVMPLLVLITGSGVAAGAGITAKALAIARPLISSFPIMAGATIVALGIGLVRMFVTQKARSRTEIADSDEATKKRRRPTPPRKTPAEDAANKRRPEERDRERGRKPRAEPAGRPQRAQAERGRAQAPGRARSGDTPNKARGDAPGRARGAAEPWPERDGRAVPPRRGSIPRQAPGRGGRERRSRRRGSRPGDPVGRDGTSGSGKRSRARGPSGP
ncbi:DUF6542 domain-containing protein [Saccharopolyspora spinosa]|uniref:DUF6542 domain-containing protein n=1 Tax=Saccharopolyspora spinosa TaxID=60894 RepID=UPI0003056889|nr:DUF6542 domain-containing protein [Saccharopolyspora spinosa]